MYEREDSPYDRPRQKMDEIEDLCISQGLPVYITKKGSERLVVLGHENYENLIAQLEELKEQQALYESLIKAATESRRDGTNLWMSLNPNYPFLAEQGYKRFSVHTTDSALWVWNGQAIEVHKIIHNKRNWTLVMGGSTEDDSDTSE